MQRWSVSAPSGDLRATVTRGARGPLELQVTRRGRSALGAEIDLDTTAARLAALPVTSLAVRTVDEQYRTTTGKQLDHHHVARQLTLRLGRGRASMLVDIQADDQGVAYRSRLGPGALASIIRERSRFLLPSTAQAWIQTLSRPYEGRYLPAPLDELAPGRYAFPALIDGGGAGRWTLLTESGATGDYAAAHLRRRSGSPAGRLDLETPRPAAAPTARSTPWRVAVIGDLDTIADSDLVSDLAGRSQIADTSWIEPGRAAWSWWSDSAASGSLDKQEAYVDFAQRAGFEYVLVDHGWKADWIPTLVSYAAARGVRILLWYAWTDLATPAAMQAQLAQVAAWGVAGVKLDFMQSDSVARMAWYEQVSREAARRRLLLEFHGSTIPRGWQRRWPNVMTIEGVRGAETYKGAVAHAMPPGDNTVLPFTRNAVGSMDYTPVTFSAVRDTSDAHELALSVLFESGIQHFADAPESYLARPIAMDFLGTVPTVWDESRLLAGRPGAFAVMARRRARTGGSVRSTPRRRATSGCRSRS